MLTMRSIKHVRSSRNIKGFRSCPHATGISLAYLDAARLAVEAERLAKRERRRLWLAQQWQEHFARL
jgi:hypothetical protein